MSGDGRTLTRRGLVALASGVALSGCSALQNPLNSPPRVDATRLTEITSGEVPVVSRTVPVDLGADHVRGHVDRTRVLLSAAPLPFDERELPNGAMRRKMNDTAREARRTLERARDAPTVLEALDVLREARGKGRTVAAAWAYADEGLRRDDLADDADSLADDVAAFRDRWSYVGDDPVRAVLVHGTVETFAAAADSVGDRARNSRLAWEPENLVTVSEYAADLERGRTALEDAAHLYDRFGAELSSPRDLETAFDDAIGELLDTLQAATADLEDGEPVSAYVDADVGDSPVRYAFEYLHSDLTDTTQITEHRNRGAVASGHLSAHRELTRLRAFGDLRERVEGGESYAIESAEDVAAYREAAVTAVETALRETDHPDLSRRVLENLAAFVEHADSEIGSYGSRERVPVDWIRRDVAAYVYVAAVARATPAATDEAAAALT